MEIKPFLNKRVKLVINEGEFTSAYTGFITNIDELFLYFRDKFNDDKIFRLSSIVKLEALNHD
jgi:hypothetical protein